MRTLLAAFRQKYDWQYNLDSDFKFPNGLTPRFNSLIQLRNKLDNTYGTGSGKQIPKGVTSTADVIERINSVFDESDLYQHQQKVMSIFGLFDCFRATKEHCELEVGHIKREPFSIQHECHGNEYYTVKGLPGKTNKLTVTNCYLRGTNDQNGSSRIPIFDEEDMKDLGGSIGIGILIRCLPFKFACTVKLSQQNRRKDSGRLSRTLICLLFNQLVSTPFVV